MGDIALYANSADAFVAYPTDMQAQSEMQLTPCWPAAGDA